jgi:hypothetical protein
MVTSRYLVRENKNGAFRINSMKRPFSFAAPYSADQYLDKISEKGGEQNY